MTLLLIAYLGGVLTLLSPCILPVLPFVFSQASRPLSRNGLPLLAGMALSFAVVATLAAVGGGWVVAANQYGRMLALTLMALFALALLWPALANWLTRPLAAAGNRLASHADNGGTSPWRSLLMGIATGLLWAPCAGPILGLILTGAALNGANIGTSLLLLAYAAGAATSLALALAAGGRILAWLKPRLGTGAWLRRVLGVAMLASVAAIALGLDTGLLTRLSTASTNALEQRLVDRFSDAEPLPGGAMRSAERDAASGNSMMMAAAPAATQPGAGMMPPLTGGGPWLNSPPLDLEALRGKVVLIDFWTYSCINCLRALPYVKAWADKYRDQGLVVIGVHTPEFAFERDLGNVTRATERLGIDYPVVIDNDYAIWRAFNNRYWPAHYFIDAQGRIRDHHFGEGDYDTSERIIQQLLREAGNANVDNRLAQVRGQGIQEAAQAAVDSHETYLGYERAERFVSGRALRDQPAMYAVPAQLALNDWGLAGGWQVEPERAQSVQAGGRIVYRFRARDLHLVLSPAADGKPVRFRVLLDGQPPGQAHGDDIAPDGSGVITEERLYQLIRQPGDIRDRTFTIEFFDPGASAYAFTFG